MFQPTVVAKPWGEKCQEAACMVSVMFFSTATAHSNPKCRDVLIVLFLMVINAMRPLSGLRKTLTLTDHLFFSFEMLPIGDK